MDVEDKSRAAHHRKDSKADSGLGSRVWGIGLRV